MTAYEQWGLIIAGAAVLVAGAGVLVNLTVGIVSHFRSKRQHRTAIRPFVTATVEVHPLHGVPAIYRCLLLRNAGPGVAFDVNTDLYLARSSGKVERVQETRPQVRPDEPIVLRAGPDAPEAVRGVIAYRDAETAHYWSACRDDSSQWERGKGSVPARVWSGAGP
jgi:hypothetical protein